MKATWYKGDTVIGQSDKYEMTSQLGVHKLTIHDVTGEDECDYSAEFKDVKSTAKLNVCGEFLKKKTFKNLMVGSKEQTDKP